MQEQSADAQRSAVTAPRSSIVMFSPASEVAFERNDLVDALLTSRAALAEPLYGAFARSAPSSSPQKSSARDPSTSPSPQSPRPLGPRADSNQFSSNARARKSIVAPVTTASYRSIRNSLDLRLRQSEVATTPALWKSPHPIDGRESNSFQPIPPPTASPAGKGGRRSVAIASPSSVPDSSASAPASRPGSARGSARFTTWKMAERASIQQIDALKSVCFDFDSRKESLGRSLTAMILDLQEQRESTLQRKLVATQKLAFHSLASDLTLLRVDTDAEQRRLLFERHRNYVWFERLVRKSARVNRDMSSAEITLFLHLRDLIESVEGLYIHPGVNVNAADAMGAAVAATLDGSLLLPPKGDMARTQRSTIVGTAASISYAALHLPAAAVDLPRLERSMSRILSGIHADLVSQKEIVEIISFLRTDVVRFAFFYPVMLALNFCNHRVLLIVASIFCFRSHTYLDSILQLRLDNMRFRASLEKAGFDLDALNDAYFVTERATRSNKPGEHTSFPRAARLAPRTSHAATADSTESPRNNSSAGDRVAADTRTAVPPLSLDGEAMFRAKYMSPRAAKLRDKLLAEESANQSARKKATNPDGSEADPPSSSFDLASSDEQAVLAHHFASKLASAFDSARAYLPAPEERYLTSVRSARLARIDRFVDGWETSPLPSARASRAMPPRVQQALGASLAVYVSAVREQRRDTEGT